MSVEKTYLSWNDFDLLTKQIVQYYQSSDIKLIVGLSRGGLPLSVTLSNLMGIPMVPLEWQTRDGSAQDMDKLITLNMEYTSSEVLFVDDLCDSGTTIKQIQGFFEDPKFATLIDKLPQEGLVQYAPIIDDSNSWIVFPWEY